MRRKNEHHPGRLLGGHVVAPLVLTEGLVDVVVEIDADHTSIVIMSNFIQFKKKNVKITIQKESALNTFFSESQIICILLLLSCVCKAGER